MKWMVWRNGKPLLRGGQVWLFDSYDEALEHRNWNSTVGPATAESLRMATRLER